MYTTKQLKIGKTDRLDELAHLAGIVYTQIVVQFWRIVRHSNHWLTEYAMKRLIRNSGLHSQTVQALVEMFYEAMKTWQANRKTDKNVRPPYKRKWYQSIPFKESAIRVKDGMLILSTGKGNEPFSIPWKYEKPKFCEISFNGKEYVINATYAMAEPIHVQGEGVAGIDLGEIHPVTVDTGKRVIIANGKKLRSKRRYQNKVKAHFQSQMDKCKKYSRRWKRLNKAKQRILTKLNNQIKDILHKQTTAIVCTMKEDGVQKVGIGDLKNIRRNSDYGAKVNQKIHQMPVGEVRRMLTYKARRLGMEVETVNEAYSSQTCPKCLKLNKTSDRNYKCEHCGLEYHRDGVGAVNIRSKTKYQKYVSVVGDMIPPVGMRLDAGFRCTSVAKVA